MEWSDRNAVGFTSNAEKKFCQLSPLIDIGQALIMWAMPDRTAAPVDPAGSEPRGHRTHRGLHCCPRCGYDLQGTVAAWRDRCELRGQCAECGLDFEWAEVLSPSVRRPRWCVEYGRLRQFPGRVIATVIISWMPWRFWSSLRMNHEPRWHRLIAYLLVLLIVAWICFALAHGAIALEEWQRVGAMGLLPANAPTGAVRAVLDNVVRPWRESYPDPAALFWRHWGPAARVGPWFALFYLLCPFGFALLPASLRHARVRRAHVVRIALYTPGLLLASFVPGVIGHGIRYTAPWPALTALGTVLIWVANILAGVLLVVPFIWWPLATSRYLRLPHGWGVGISLTLIALLLTLLVIALLLIAGRIMPPWWL